MSGSPGLTVNEIADHYRLDPSTVYRWVNSSRWMEAIVSMDPVRYDPDRVEELVQYSQHRDQNPEPSGHHAGLTVREISAKYRISIDTVHRWVRGPGWKDAVVGKRGAAKEYDAKIADDLVRERIWLPPVEPEIPAGRLLTLADIAEYTGISYEDVKHMAADVSGRGSVLGPHDDVDGDRRMWRRETVDERVRGRQKRKKKRP